MSKQSGCRAHGNFSPRCHQRKSRIRPKRQLRSNAAIILFLRPNVNSQFCRISLISNKSLHFGAFFVNWSECTLVAIEQPWLQQQKVLR
jgi:hypothetical protein